MDKCFIFFHLLKDKVNKYIKLKCLCIIIYMLCFPMYLILFTSQGFLLPMIPVIVVLATDGYQLSRFPPSLCTPDGGKFFYSASLIINVLLCTGVCFLIGIFWIIHTVCYPVFAEGNRSNSVLYAHMYIW